MRPDLKFPPDRRPPFEIPMANVECVQRKWLDLAYASQSPAQKLDIYLPNAGEAPFPVILHIHGGGFAIGDKRDIHLLPYLRALQRGYAVVSVNYRMSGEAIFPAAVMDLKAAIRWLRAHAASYLLDSNRLAACGGSAGGNLSAVLALTAGVAELEDQSQGSAGFSCEVQAAVDMFGPTDFLKMDEQLAQNGLGPCDHNEAESPESRYLGAPITRIPEKAALANPMTYIRKDMPPMLIQHGRIDHLVPVQQSICFVKKIKEMASPDRVEFDILENADHGDRLFETEQNMNRVFAFVDRWLK
jgi:acetyl esterase/lipase